MSFSSLFTREFLYTYKGINVGPKFIAIFKCIQRQYLDTCIDFFSTTYVAFGAITFQYLWGSFMCLSSQKLASFRVWNCSQCLFIVLKKIEIISINSTLYGWNQVLMRMYILTGVVIHFLTRNTSSSSIAGWIFLFLLVIYCIALLGRILSSSRVVLFKSRSFLLCFLERIEVIHVSKRF